MPVEPMVEDAGGCELAPISRNSSLIPLPQMHGIVAE